MDYTGEVRGYAVVDMRALGTYDWRLAGGNVWKAERLLLDYPHRRIRTARARVARLRARYLRFRADHPTGSRSTTHGASAGRRSRVQDGKARLPGEFMRR